MGIKFEDERGSVYGRSGRSRDRSSHMTSLVFRDSSAAVSKTFSPPAEALLLSIAEVGAKIYRMLFRRPAEDLPGRNKVNQ